MPEPLVVQSHRGPYRVSFGAGPFRGLERGLPAGAHLLVDARVAKLWGDALGPALAGPSVLQLEATEEAKSLERFAAYASSLIERGIRRDHELVAVGGGIVQDITCFLAATLLRGLPWRFYPTTLLAQADSCIGSKSSINVGPYKNQLGTFTPPREVVISTDVLDTLEEADVRSGVGEMLKAHLVAGWEETRVIARDYPRLLANREVMAHYIRRSLDIKKALVEADEFDRDARLVMNYGHTFGHALESASRYAIPHGIAVTIGMDLANVHALRLGLIDDTVWSEIHGLLRPNYRGFERVPIDCDRFFAAIGKDKKNRGSDLSLVLMRGGPGRLFLGRHPLDEGFREACREYFARLEER